MKKKSIRIISASAASLLLVSVLCIGSYAALKNNGVIASDEYIGVEKAKEIALSHAGIASDSAWFEDAELDRERGVDVYEIEFYSNSIEYDYKVDAKSGEVLKARSAVDGDLLDASAPNQDSAYIGIDAAKQIALEHAGVAAADARFADLELDRDDGKAVYEFDFYAGGVEYEYKIDALSGEVLRSKVEGRPAAPAPEAPASGSSASEASAPEAPAPEAPAPAYIGMDAAKASALSHAGLSAADVRFEDAELDWERGKAVYELDFRSGRYEFEYEIDALSGEVLNFEKEIDD